MEGLVNPLRGIHVNKRGLARGQNDSTFLGQRTEKEKKIKKSQSNNFSLLEKKWRFHVRLQISSWYFHISKVAWK